MSRRRWTKPRRTGPTCPTPGKTAHATRESAEHAARHSPLTLGLQLATYQCPCGWHHLTKGPGDRRHHHRGDRPMTTTTHTPRRVQRKRTAGWTAPRDQHGQRPVYVGRGTAWGNPYAVVRMGDGQYAIPDPIDSLASPWATFDTAREARAEAAVLFRGWLVGRPKLIDRAHTELSGRDLMCWCPYGQPCHADVLLEVANPPAPASSGSPVGAREDGAK